MIDVFIIKNNFILFIDECIWVYFLPLSNYQVYKAPTLATLDKAAQAQHINAIGW